MTDCEREKRLLAQLDRIGAEDPFAWDLLVRYFAPEMAERDNKLLAEIVIRRGMASAKERAKVAPEVDCIEIMAQMFGSVGLKVVVK